MGHSQFLLSSEKAKKYADEQYEFVRDRYPKSVSAAYNLCQYYLAMYAPNKLAIFQGNCAVGHSELNFLLTGFLLIAMLLDEENSGNPNINPIIKDVMCRKYLGLKPLVITGGRAINP